MADGTEEWSPWTVMDELVESIETNPIFVPSEEDRQNAEPHLRTQWEQMERMKEAVRARDIEELRALISGEALVFAYTSLIRTLLEQLEMPE